MTTTLHNVHINVAADTTVYTYKREVQRLIVFSFQIAQEGTQFRNRHAI